MEIITPAIRFLEERSISFQVFHHHHPPASLEQAALERGQSPSQVIRSILFRSSSDEFYMVLVAGPGQISWRRLRSHLGISRLSLATLSEIQKVTGYEIGTVNPFGLPYPVRILADIGVFSQEVISIGCGKKGAAILMRSDDIRRALGTVEKGSFVI